MNIDTKNALESKHFLSFSAAVQARLTQCLRNDGSNIRPFSAPSDAIEAIKLGLNLVQPKNAGMKRITDGTNSFGQSMADAVRVYKSNNGIIRAGQRLDNIVGRGTLAHLDTDLKNNPNVPGLPRVPPTVPGPGSANWRFSFFCDKALFGRGYFVLNIASAEVQEASQFTMTELSSASGLGGGFKGVSRGTFTTARRFAVKTFGLATVEFSVTRLASSQLRGTMRIQGLADAALQASFALPDFVDETGGTRFGTAVVTAVLSQGT